MGRLEPTASASHDLLSKIHGGISQIEAGLAARLDQIEAGLAARLDQIEAGLAARLDLLAAAQAQLTARDGALVATVAAEVDRLDGYLAHHAAMLQESLADNAGDLLATLQGSVAAIRGDLNPLREAALSLAHRPERAYVAPGLDVLVIAASCDLIVPTEEAGLLAYILQHGLEAIEPGVRAVLRDRLKQGAVAVDAGANIGIHAITMASAVGPKGRVLCFEPLPHLAKALERTLRINGFGSRAQVHQTALGDEAGEATLHRAAHGPMSSIYLLPEGMGAEPIQVRMATLDESFAPGARVDLVKIDVEGAEPRVWRGMRRILQENAEIEIVLEWSSSHFQRTGENPAAFMAEIRAAGFSSFLIADDATAGRLTPLRDGVAALDASNLLLTRRPVAQDALRDVESRTA
jgi:FkbM family methyltransferase